MLVEEGSSLPMKRESPTSTGGGSVQTAYYAYLCNIRTNDERTLAEIRKIEDGERSWEISKFENSYRRERDRSKITADIKELYRQKISEIIGNDGHSAYQICKELHIDQSNFSKFLKGDVARISLDTVRAIHEMTSFSV